MRSACLLVVLAACVAEELPHEEPAEATVQSAVVTAPTNLRIASFNIHGGVRVNPLLRDEITHVESPGYNLPYDYLAMVASQIRSANADVVLLQEVQNHAQSGGCDDQPARLQHLLGDLYPYTHYAPDYAQATFSCGSFWSVTSGQMILSKLPLYETRNTPLEQPRGRFGMMHAQSAKVAKAGVVFRIYNTHFSTVPEDIVAGFKELRKHIDATVGDAVVLAAGDFNWAIFDDPVPQSPMTSRPLFHHGEGIDHLWSDWPHHISDGSFPSSPPVAASDHPMVWWDLSWVGDQWVTLGQKRAWGFGMSSTPSVGSSGNIYARNASTPVRGRKGGITDPWIEDARLGNPNDADPGYRLARTADPYGCEIVGWRNTTFTWALEMGPSCTLSQPITTPQPIQSAPAIASFSRWIYFFGNFWTFHNYFVFTTLNAGGTLAWSHHEGTSPTPPQTAFTTWNVHTDGAAKQNSSPAVIVPGYVTYGACAQIFIRDTNDRLQTKSLCYDGSYTWSPWTNLDRPAWDVNLASSPAAAAGAGNEMHACVIGTDQQVWCKSFFNNTWNAFRSCGAPPGGAFGDPAVALDSSGDLTVYVRGKGNRIFLRRCNR